MPREVMSPKAELSWHDSNTRMVPIKAVNVWFHYSAYLLTIMCNQMGPGHLAELYCIVPAPSLGLYKQPRVKGSSDHYRPVPKQELSQYLRVVQRIRLCLEIHAWRKRMDDEDRVRDASTHTSVISGIKDRLIKILTSR